MRFINENSRSNIILKSETSMNHSDIMKTEENLIENTQANQQAMNLATA